jgi:hypothetical protein
MVKINLFFWLVIICSNSFCQNNNDYKYLGDPYYPEQFLQEKDSLKWPIEFDLSIDVKDIKNIDLNKDEFFSILLVSSYSNYDTSYTSIDGDTISLLHEEFFDIYIKENTLGGDVVKPSKYYKNTKNYKYLFYDNFKTKSVKRIEAPFDLNWDLKNFPFDKQKLKFKFITTVDTSIIKLRPSIKFPSGYNSPLENLKEGFNVEGISYEYKYNNDESDLIRTSPNTTRGIVTETLEIILTLDRQGSWLFLKLFLGGILSFLISCLVFLIPIKTEFESKVTLAVGGIFGAIGNRYYVDSVLPGLQVFTKADAVSNLVIFMVVFNILITILQQSEKTNFSYFQSPKNAFYYSLYIFSIVFLGILIY